MAIKALKYCGIALIILLAGCQDDEEARELEEAGQEVINLLQSGEYETIYENWFSKELQTAMSVEELAEEWESRIEGEELIESSPLRLENKTESTTVVEATLAYPSLEFDVRMVFNEAEQLVGFNLSDGIMKVTMPNTIEEEEITVGEGSEYELEGLLTLPKSAEGKLPAVILVQGSGPTDRDETAYAYKPFRDIAWRLAEQGIAVIRYDKRTFTYGSELAKESNQLSVYEETVEDAIRASELAKSDPRIHEEQIFIIGHSLGGMLAPRIDAQGGDFKGIIILAGSPRPLWDIVYDQNLYLIEGFISDESERNKQLKFVEEEYEKAEELQEMTDQEAMETTVFGINGYYLKEMEKYEVPVLISELKKPILILHGEEDFQVYEKDFKQWQELLGDRENADFISYPNLNHFFIEYEGPGKGTPVEYETPNQVSKEVIEDMGEWILENQ